MRHFLWVAVAGVSTLLTLNPNNAAFQATAAASSSSSSSSSPPPSPSPPPQSFSPPSPSGKDRDQHSLKDSAGGVSAVFWTLPYNLTEDYAAKALVFALQGLANRGTEAALFINTTTLDFGSDDAWHDYLARELNVTWQSLEGGTISSGVIIEGGQPPPGGSQRHQQQLQQQQQQQQPFHARRLQKLAAVQRTDEDTLQESLGSSSSDGDELCALVEHFQHVSPGLAVYPDDGFSVYVALTMASVEDVLPVSEGLLRNHSCLGAIPGLPVVQDFRANESLQFADKMEAHHWAVDNLLPHCSRSIVFNANMGPNADAGQDVGTILSVDYPVAQRAFIMNLCPLWTCDTSPNSTDLNCGPHSHRVAKPLETALYVQIIESLDELVSVWGWSDPEHAFTNITSHAGGAVFCTFSTPNLSFWRSLSLALGLVPLPLPANHDSGRPLDNDTVYVVFETNEGDTPRILTSQFTSAWLSPNRGSVPVAWAVDPLLAEMFPALWNFFASSATANDTFVAGVDGAGYVFVAELGGHEEAYEQRAGRVLAEIGPNVVDTGVAVAGWADVATPAMLEKYLVNARKNGGKAPDAFVNACGSHWGQPVNGWLSDGVTPVINSVCYGPPGNHSSDSDGHYLYYYRDRLDPEDPAGDLARRIAWAASSPNNPPGARSTSTRQSPQFILVFGGLGLYGGHDDFFLFVQRVMAQLSSDALEPGANRTFQVVGAQEMARLARLAGPNARSD